MKHALRSAWDWLAEPTLMRRNVASVLVAFVVVWAVLLGYNFVNYKHTITRDPGLMKYGDAVLDSLASVTDPAHAATAMAATDHWTNIRRRQVGLLPGVQMHELLDAASGQRVFASPGLQNVAVPPASQRAEPYIEEAALQGRSFRIYTGRNARWVLRVFETKRTDSNFLQYNGRALLPYLLLASPFVLLAVWLSVRHGLRPLQQLASRIAQRGQDDLQSVGFNSRHRELKPLEQSLDHLFTQLRQKVDRERAFVQDAAHEIRTPLAVITAQAHVMARSPSEEERTQAQAHLEQAIARTSHLAQQLLDLAALDTRSAPLRATWTWRSGCAAHWRRPCPRRWHGRSNCRWTRPTPCPPASTNPRSSPSPTTSSTTRCATRPTAATWRWRCGARARRCSCRCRTTGRASRPPNTTGCSNAFTGARAMPPTARAWALPSCGRRCCAWAGRCRSAWV